MKARLLPLLLLLGCTPTVGPARTPPPVAQRQTLAGTLRWRLDFDAEAEAAGHWDCDYVRAYAGVEDRTRPWFCADCDVLFRADVELIEGAECYAQLVPDGVVPAEEWLGWNAQRWFRGSTREALEQGTWSGAEQGPLELVHAFEGQVAPLAGGFDVELSGAVALDAEAGDPWHGLSFPDRYACGWPTDAPETSLSGAYRLERDARLPDAWLRDRCDEQVRLHDFGGTPLLVVLSAMDCPPCQLMAEDEPAFVAEQRAAGQEVRVVTLLVPSLLDPTGTPSAAQLGLWSEAYGDHAALADELWTVAVAGPALGAELAWPTTILVRPDLTVIDWEVGYTDDTFERIGARLR